MIFALFALIRSQTQIHVCNKKYSSLCSNIVLNVTSNSMLNDFILPYIDKNKETILEFYSDDEESILKLDLSDFIENEIILKNKANSKLVNIIIKNNGTFIKQLSIEPNNQILLSRLINMYQTKNNVVNKNPTFLANALNSANKEFDELDGLINVTCDRLNYSGYAYCHKSKDIFAGSSCNQVDCKLNYTFNGTRIHIVSYSPDDPNSVGIMNISIDGKFIDQVQPGLAKDNEFRVVFSSEYYPYGEHTIKINGINVGVNSKFFYVNSFLLDPLPKVGGHILRFEDAEKDGSWTLDSSKKTPFFTSSTKDASLTFKFHGTRFWLTGIRHDNYGNCTLTIDEGEGITIDGRTGIDNFNGENVTFDRANGNMGVLLYESDVLDFKDHTIKIVKNDDKQFCIINLLYSTQPYNAIVVPKEEISIDEHWTSENEGYSTNYDGARASITEYLNHFWIIGNRQPNNQAMMNIHYNEETKNNININSIDSEFNNEILLTTLKNISHDTYLIEVEKTGSSSSTSSNEDTLHINYMYYLNEKTISPTDQSHVIGISELESSTEGKWESKNDNIYTEEKDASVSMKFFGNKFWIYGTVDPNYGTIDIIFNGQKQSSVSLYNEKHIENIIIYESPNGVSQEEHSLTLVNQKNTPISIYQVVYQVLPSTEEFTLSNGFTNSYFFSKTEQFSETGFFSRTGLFTFTTDFTRSELFTKSSGFTPTQGFSKSTAFSASEPFPESGDVCLFESLETNYTTHNCNFSIDGEDDIIIRVIQTNFTDYFEKGDGGAVHIINCGLDCTSISFNRCVSTNGGGGAIYIRNSYELQHNITIKNTSFIKCQALYGGACYFYSHLESNGVQIISSYFSQNVATERKGTTENNNLFGGNHIFVTAKNLLILDSKFEKGKGSGGSVKIYNVFDQVDGRAIKLDKTQNHILIIGCNFELDKGAKTSINFIDEIETSKLELVDCNFAGKMTKGSHYIDGKVGSKEYDNIKIVSCNFEDKNELAVKIDTFEKDQLIENNLLQKNISFGLVSFKLIIMIFLFSVALIISLILFVLKSTKRQHNFL